MSELGSISAGFIDGFNTRYIPRSFLCGQNLLLYFGALKFLVPKLSFGLCRNQCFQCFQKKTQLQDNGLKDRVKGHRDGVQVFYDGHVSRCVHILFKEEEHYDLQTTKQQFPSNHDSLKQI